MSVAAISPTTSRWSGPDLRRQLLANHTVEDVLALPDDVPRVELRDGVMMVVPSPTFTHQAIGNLLWTWFHQHAPDDYAPVTGFGLAVSPEDTYEPDLMLLRKPFPRSSHYVRPDHVTLVVEVVNIGTRRRDRLERPGQYAEAGIQHFWRIEQDPVRVHAYTLDGDAYRQVAATAEELVLTEPFDIRLPVSDLVP
jgi:Uma2 family endonuclease